MSYDDLCEAFPVGPIRDDAHLDAAVKVIDGFLDIVYSLTPDEETYLSELSEAVEAYEDRTVPM